MKNNRARLTAPLLRIVVAAVFILSGVTKLVQPYQNFLSVIQSYQVLSGWGAVAAARTVPWIEFIFGVFLLLGLWLRLSITALWMLSTVFAGIVVSALIRRLPIGDCGCFGGSFSLSPGQVLFLDAALWAAFAILMLFHNRVKVFSLDNRFENEKN